MFRSRKVEEKKIEVKIGWREEEGGEANEQLCKDSWVVKFFVAPKTTAAATATVNGEEGNERREIKSIVRTLLIKEKRTLI